MEATFWGLHLASKNTRPSIAIGICKSGEHVSEGRCSWQARQPFSRLVWSKLLGNG